MQNITYTWQFDSTVTAFWRSTSLLDVKISKLTTGGLNDADLVRPGVVSMCKMSIRNPITVNSRDLRVATSECQSVGRHFGGLLLRMSIDVVGR